MKKILYMLIGAAIAILALGVVGFAYAQAQKSTSATTAGRRRHKPAPTGPGHAAWQNAKRDGIWHGSPGWHDGLESRLHA